MCGRTTLKITPEDLRRTFGYEPPPDYRPRYNIAPSQPILTLADTGEGMGLRHLRWGLVPFWAKDPRIGSRMINARAEGIASKPAYRAAFARRRCLVVVDGFYEWRAGPGGKQPFRICRADDSAFTLAGLWERWDRGPETIESCVIVTTPPNGLMAPIHDRMPAIVASTDRARWLSGDSSREELESLLRPYEGDDLVAYAVSTLVNNPANDVEACIEPLPEMDVG